MGDNGVNGELGNNHWPFESNNSYNSETDEDDNTGGTEQDGFHIVNDDDHLVHGASSDSEDSDNDDNAGEEEDGFCEPEG